MYTLSVESNEIFRTTSPREMTCELWLVRIKESTSKNNVRILQTQRAKQTLKKSKIFGLIVGIVISKETTRGGKSCASTQITSIGRPHSCTPTCKCFCNGALAPTSTIRSVDCDSWGWQWRTNPVLSPLFVGSSGTTSAPTMDIGG